MATPKKIILLACGSFNPPTHMHLRIFEIARDYLHRMGKYQVVAGLMSPVHDSYGKKDLASSSDRCEMVRRSLQSSDWVHLSDWECHQTGWTPTRQVLHHHQELVDSIVNGNLDSTTKRQRTDELAWAHELGSEQLHMKLLCGGDLLESFGKPGLWKDEDIEAIVGSYGLVVITREGSNPLKFIYESDVLTRLQRNIDLVTEWIANEVSSSRIRRALSRCESVKYLLPDPVIAYVHQRALYGASSEYVRPLSLLLVPGMPPSFLTPSPCDVDMTYCERPPVLTLTAPDASAATDVRSPLGSGTAPSPPRQPAPVTPPGTSQRPESGRCRTWRRGGEKKPGSSRRVRPEPTAKVSGRGGGDGGRDGQEGGGETPPQTQEREGQHQEGRELPPPADRTDHEGELTHAVGTGQEAGEVERTGDLPPPETDVTEQGNTDDELPEPPPSVEQDIRDQRDCEDDLSGPLSAGSPDGADDGSREQPAVTGADEWVRAADTYGIPPERDTAGHRDHRDLPSVFGTDRDICGEDGSHTPPPEPPGGDDTGQADRRHGETGGDGGPPLFTGTDRVNWEVGDPPPSPRKDGANHPISEPPAATVADQGGCELDRDDNRPLSSPGGDSTDCRGDESSPAIGTVRGGYRAALDGNTPVGSLPQPNSTYRGYCDSGGGGGPPSITVTDHGDCDVDGDGNQVCQEPPEEESGAADGRHGTGGEREPPPAAVTDRGDGGVAGDGEPPPAAVTGRGDGGVAGDGEPPPAAVTDCGDGVVAGDGEPPPAAVTDCGDGVVAGDGEPPPAAVTGRGGGGVAGDGEPCLGRDITDGDRVRIELRLDGVTVVSGRETRL